MKPRPEVVRAIADGICTMAGRYIFHPSATDIAQASSGDITVQIVGKYMRQAQADINAILKPWNLKVVYYGPTGSNRNILAQVERPRVYEIFNAAWEKVEERPAFTSHDAFMDAVKQHGSGVVKLAKLKQV